MHRLLPQARRARTERARRPAAAAALAVLVATALASGCVGQQSRNDDHVGPNSYRPDEREHTLPAAGGT